MESRRNPGTGFVPPIPDASVMKYLHFKMNGNTRSVLRLLAIWDAGDQAPYLEALAASSQFNSWYYHTREEDSVAMKKAAEELKKYVALFEPLETRRNPGTGHVPVIDNENLLRWLRQYATYLKVPSIKELLGRWDHQQSASISLAKDASKEFRSGRYNFKEHHDVLDLADELDEWIKLFEPLKTRRNPATGSVPIIDDQEMLDKLRYFVKWLPRKTPFIQQMLNAWDRYGQAPYDIVMQAGEEWLALRFDLAEGYRTVELSWELKNYAKEFQPMPVRKNPMTGLVSPLTEEKEIIDVLQNWKLRHIQSFCTLLSYWLNDKPAPLDVFDAATQDIIDIVHGAHGSLTQSQIDVLKKSIEIFLEHREAFVPMNTRKNPATGLVAPPSASLMKRLERHRHLKNVGVILSKWNSGKQPTTANVLDALGDITSNARLWNSLYNHVDPYFIVKSNPSTDQVPRPSKFVMTHLQDLWEMPNINLALEKWNNDGKLTVDQVLEVIEDIKTIQRMGKTRASYRDVLDRVNEKLEAHADIYVPMQVTKNPSDHVKKPGPLALKDLSAFSHASVRKIVDAWKRKEPVTADAVRDAMHTLQDIARKVNDKGVEEARKARNHLEKILSNL